MAPEGLCGDVFVEGKLLRRVGDFLGIPQYTLPLFVLLQVGGQACLCGLACFGLLRNVLLRGVVLFSSSLERRPVPLHDGFEDVLLKISTVAGVASKPLRTLRTSGPASTNFFCML